MIELLSNEQFAKLCAEVYQAHLTGDRTGVEEALNKLQEAYKDLMVEYEERG